MDPLPGLPADLWDRMAAYLRGIDASLGRRPAAILVISGHWETAEPTVNTALRPPLLFDYSGFPEHTYRLTYPVAGSPALAARVRGLLSTAGIPSGEDPHRGLDHGVFVPFKVMYPDADVPVVQLSLNRNRDASTHLAMGRALAPLRDEDVLIVGSGMSYHNLREFFVDRPDDQRGGRGVRPVARGRACRAGPGGPGGEARTVARCAGRARLPPDARAPAAAAGGRGRRRRQRRPPDVSRSVDGEGRVRVSVRLRRFLE